MSDSIVSYRLEDRVAVVTFDDGKVNALGHALLDGVGAALDRAEEEARAVVLVGRPGRFSAGFDLKELTSGPERAVALFEKGAMLYQRLYGFPKPVVAACTGHAVAGGALLLLSADLRVGAEGDFQLGLNEVAIGLTLPRLAIELATARLDPRRLTEATVLGQVFGPAEAVAVGYLDRVVPGDALRATAIAEAARLGTLPSPALAATKRAVRAGTLERMVQDLRAELAVLMPAR
ncbi:MAG: crotonase/enoyl-CoA hydratase family protein [Myxococcales bacterium]|nr:crotonase/enoyl-CoA hydratase family protein [Myxococcales bacterium]